MSSLADPSWRDYNPEYSPAPPLTTLAYSLLIGTKSIPPLRGYPSTTISSSECLKLETRPSAYFSCPHLSIPAYLISYFKNLAKNHSSPLARLGSLKLISELVEFWSMQCLKEVSNMLNWFVELPDRGSSCYFYNKYQLLCIKVYFVRHIQFYGFVAQKQMSLELAKRVTILAKPTLQKVAGKKYFLVLFQSFDLGFELYVFFL